MNKAIFTGNLTRDPETSVTQSGDPQTKFTIAVNRPFKNANGERDADFIQVKCYNKNAENAAKYLKKGRKVGVVCKVRTGSYKKDEQTIYTTDFIVEDLEFLSSAQDDGATASPEPAKAQPAQPAQQAQQASNVPQGFTAVNDDGLPF